LTALQDKQRAETAPFLAGGGALAELISARDWSPTLGPIAAWPQSLKTTVGLLLHSPVPIVLLWGPDGIMLYNDAYSGFAGGRHPALLGSKVREGWPEVADFNDHVMKVGLGGGTLSYKDQELTLHRSGKPEAVWMNLDYSPIIDESGKPGGVIAIVVETTARVLAERHANFEREHQRRLFAQMPGFVAVLKGPQHNYEYVNQAYLGLTGDRDFVGKTVRQALPELEGQGYFELLDSVYADGLSHVARGMPVQLIGESEIRYVDFVYEPVRDEAGAVTGIFVGGYETTDAYRTAEALRQSEADLRVSESQFRGFAQAVPNHVWAAAPDGLLNWFNQRVYDYGGAAPGTLDGTGWTAMVHPDDLEFAAARWNASLVSGAVYETEFRLRRADGVYRWHVARAVPIRDDSGAITRWIGTNTDIEEQKSALAELRTLNAELERRVIERTQARGRTWQLSPDLMGALNAKGYFETSNPAWQTMLGWSEAEVASMSIFELLHPDDVARTRAGFELTQQGQPAIQFPNRYRCKDGSYRWISWVGVPDEDGFVYCSGRDITAERQRDAELLNIRTFYTYSSEFHAMLAQRDDGTFEYEEINPATLQLYGMTREQVIGRTVDDLFEPPVAAILNSHLTEALRLGEPHRYIRSQNGTAIEAIATPVPADGGRRRLTVTARDVSERLSLEEQLRQAQKMEAVGQLTGGIAHDFNNLLQGITGSLDRVQYRLAEGRTSDVDRFLKAAIESANRAAALTHRLLAFSRRQTLDPKALDANKLIAGMEDLIRRTIGPNVSMEVVAAGGLWPIRVDPSQLENSLLNLSINARDAMPDGGKLTIETANKWLDERGAREHELTPGQYVSLSVSDTGTGMTDEVIARAFDPFFTTKPTGRGTGLGLSMIYGFVRQSGGQVRIYSEPGQGTTMCLYFPRHQGSVEDETSAVTETVERGFGETVLVVDDEATVRMLIAEVLSESFYNILEAGDGAAALKILETDRRVDLMITDVGLPGGMNGRQVADAARVLRKNLKVLFITGYAENAAIGGGHLDAGMEILAKPFAMSTLGNKVREMLEARV